MSPRLALFLAGVALVVFLATFLIVFFQDRRRVGLGRILVDSTLMTIVELAVIVLVATGLFFYCLREQKIDHSQPPLTAEEARRDHCPIPLPDSARNVQFAHASGGMAFEYLVRFEAPAEVCRAEVTVVCASDLLKGKEIIRPPVLQQLRERPKPEDHDMLGRAKWFDVERIDHGLTTYSYPATNYSFWIDEDRGVFYFKITD